MNYSVPRELITKDEARNVIFRRLGPFLLERFDGDLQNRIEKLLGLSDTAVFFEFLSLLIYFETNFNGGIIDSSQIITCLASQSEVLIKALLAIDLVSVHAFFENLIAEIAWVDIWSSR